MIDVVEVLSDSSVPKRYWSDLKSKLRDEGSEVYEKIVRLKMEASDGKMRQTDVADTETLLRLVQSIPSPKAEPFKVWLAKVGYERIEETQDPELTIDYMTLDMFTTLIGQKELNLILDLVLAVVAGFIIGVERESRGKDAGISTHTMVITGAMLFTFMSSIVDPASKSRIAAQIVSGIGFLGAGMILKEGTTVRNLTTAASIWVSGAIGMAFGFNFHMIGIIVTIAVALIPRIPHINKKIPEALIEVPNKASKRKTWF